MTTRCVIHPDREGTRVPLFNGRDEVLCPDCARRHGPRPPERPVPTTGNGAG